MIARFRWLKRHGLRRFAQGCWLFLTAHPWLILPRRLTPYRAWLRWNRPAENRARILTEDAAALANTPLFSLLLPVLNTAPELLLAAIESVLQQVYQRWELVIVDDGSTATKTLTVLAELPSRDPRIRVLRHAATANISLATNTAAAAASGEYFVLLDHDDVLSPDALAQVALYLAAHPECDWLYSDEDLIDMSGSRSSPRFKPDWSPELLLAFCYIGHLLVFRASLWQRLGGMRPGFEGSQDHDLLLRASEVTSHVGHVSQILYHWRTAPGSTATRGDAKPLAFSAGRRAISEAFARRGVPCHVEQPEWAHVRRLGVFAPVFPDAGPSVAIIVPTQNSRSLLEECLASLQQTTYVNYSVHVVDNESDNPATCDYLAWLGAGGHGSNPPVTVWRIPNPAGRFNYAHLMNTAASRVTEDFLLLLNDDVTVIDPRWLSQMVGYLRLEGVGAVGARLVFPDGRVQHAGVLHGLDHGGVGHAFKLIDGHELGYLLQAGVSRNCSAVTAACMLTTRKYFLESNGLDETNFSVAYNDVDYCARLRHRGLRIVCAPVTLRHREGATRGFGDMPSEVASMRSRYGSMRDPYYNSHLSLDDESFAIRPGVVDWGGASRRHRQPVRAVFVTHNLNREGAPLCQFDLIRGLRKEGVIDPILFSPVDGPLRDEWEATGVRVVVARPEVRKSLAEQLAEVIRNCGAEVLHANTLDSAWAVVVAGQTETPSLWNIHESEDWHTYLLDGPVSAATRTLRALAQPYRVVFVSRASRNVWQNLERSGNFAVIPNGFDVDQFRKQLGVITRRAARQRLGLSDGTLLLLAVGTVCPRKRQQDMVRAFARLPAATAARLRLLIVGDRQSDYTAEYSRQLHALVDELPADRRMRVSVELETADTATFWQAADIFCCASETESYPRTLQEAMAAGLPIVTTPVFGIPEMVRPGVNAEFYPVGNIDMLTAAIGRLVSDDDLRGRYASHSPAVLAGTISYGEMIDEYARLFREARLTAADVAAWEAGNPLSDARSLARRVLGRLQGLLLHGKGNR
jgi:glycosyltransferase involved in cell wall biosynthesis